MNRACGIHCVNWERCPDHSMVSLHVLIRGDWKAEWQLNEPSQL